MKPFFQLLFYCSALPHPDRLGRAQAEPRQQAPLVLVHLREGVLFAEVAAGFGVGFGVGTATAWPVSQRP